MTHTASMSGVRFKMKATKGTGIGVDDAVAAAEKNLDKMRDRIVAEVDAKIAAIRERTPRLLKDDADASASIVDSADVLTGLCVSPDLVPIGEVARALCKLSDEVEGPLPFEAAKLLADTLVFLREQSDGSRRAAWDQLREGVDAALKTAAHRRIPKTLPPPPLPN